MKTIIIREPDDFHVHFRQGEMLKHVVPYTSRVFRRAMVMPNTTPPILNASDVVRYRQEIVDAAGTEKFKPLMTIKLAASTIPTIIKEAAGTGVVAVKLYPEGVTTNSEDGIKLDDLERLHPVFDAMQKFGIILSIHGEVPDEYVMDREHIFLYTFQKIISQFPRLRVVLEHITTAEAVSVIKHSREGVGATITLHHLMLTLNDVLCDKRGGNEFLNPHHYCKPVAKQSGDREALLHAAFSGDPKFFFGSDTAPHLREKKECDSGCAGVWSAPVALPLLAQIFDNYGQLDRLENFVSVFGARFYSLALNQKTIGLVEIQPKVVPRLINDIVPFYAGKNIGWEVF